MWEIIPLSWRFSFVILLENTAVRDQINNSRVDLGESVKQIDHTDNITAVKRANN